MGAPDNRSHDHDVDSMSPVTPNTEFSAPYSPQQKYQLLKDTRISARKKLAQLTLQEKVCSVLRFPSVPSVLAW